ncbi:hypothetical protein [uncultured Tenacibaculum sp.]|uniref:hypothetical protein n=1 Tax=uncultured Tenacibaculum sp. TaxID=174713 RepID=UPI002614BF87|nr:hypothetical protein [uncultured Tenacibaculum sp.]
MKYINRILMLIFTILLLSGIFDRSNLGIAALFAIPLGFVQLLYAISLGLRWETLNIKGKYFIGSYLLTVLVYFIFLVKNPNFNGLLLSSFFIGLPLILAYSLTAFIELKKFDY